jgi:uncharacterized membrane protein YobD (UPF0266 family)
MNYRGVFMVPVICSVFMGVVTWLVYAAMYALTKSNTVSVIIALAAALVSYFVPVMLFKKKGLY